MYITRPTRTSQNGKTYETILLRESYCADGKVKNRTIANLTHCNPHEIAALELALKHKDDLTALVSLSEAVEVREGLSVGVVWAVYQVAKRLGIEKALGRGMAGQLAMWQVMARVMDQGSRLSAVRLAQMHAGGDVLQMKRGFDEDDLYENLKWLVKEQAGIERRLLRERRGKRKPELFLYDVTSSYLEGQENELAAYGYNRDGKRGKKPIVIGLLCDETGEPVSTEVFTENTQDVKTLASQVRKAAERFGCERVTFVGDRGMIKSAGIEALSQAGFHYITALTNPQIETLLKAGVLQMEWFDEELCEVERAFRTCKTGHLEIRPVYVRTEESTRSHVLVVMLAYLIVRELQRAWASLDVTVEEGLHQLSTLCSLEIWVNGQASCHNIPQPRELSQKLLAALGVRWPEVLPHRNLRVVTKKKLPSRRKTA